jgi:adenine/guanine phosphoribosyltransferase-like PRPP-binding protein
VVITTAKRFLAQREFIFVDDFLATGETLMATVSMVNEAGGRVLAACVVFDKPFQHITPFPKIPLISVLQIENMKPPINGFPAEIKFVGRPAIEMKRQ